jgi:hypothetical protein
MLRIVLALGLLATQAVAISIPEVEQIGRCQKGIASAGAKFALKSIRSTLKCTNAVAECQIQCDYGVFGPSCNTSGPPCCDSDDPNSNTAFGLCMLAADAVCSEQDANIDEYELSKQTKIINSCGSLTIDQLCGANGDGLNFALLAAGCQALDPTWTCSLNGILSCVGGPLQQQLTDQISALLDPRAPEAVAAIGAQNRFQGIPVTRKAKEDVAAGRTDIFAITGAAGDEIIVRVKTNDDTGTGGSTLKPTLRLLNVDMASTVADTTLRSVPCAVPNACGSTCPMFRRVLPYDGTFFLSVSGAAAPGCGGGGYRLVVTSPSGSPVALVADDIPTP